jgi:hypothetical protein
MFAGWLGASRWIISGCHAGSVPAMRCVFDQNDLIAGKNIVRECTYGDVKM